LTGVVGFSPSDVTTYLNVGFLASLAAVLVLTFAVIPYGKRRPIGTPVSWGEAMFAATYAFFTMFLAYGVMPHQFLAFADNELRWRSDVIAIGRNPAAKVFHWSWFPFDVSAQTFRDLIVVVIYGAMLGLQIFIWSWWQNRGKVKPTPAELTTSSYGRPLVRRG
jgi:hypothetical protein